MAVDGVAPRAKMNQQRSRRFKSAKDAAKTKELLRKEGNENWDKELFDTNAISPGTEFMFKLNEQLEFFIQYKINTDPLYKNVS
jgi:5'-3' exoribonuclease 1